MRVPTLLSVRQLKMKGSADSHRASCFRAILISLALLNSGSLPATVAAPVEDLAPVQVFFSRDPESLADFTAVFPLARDVPADPDVMADTLGLLLSGPTSGEQAAGYFSDFKALVVGTISTCKGAFLLHQEGGVVTVQLCRATSSAGAGQDARAQTEVNATLQQFPGVSKVVVLDRFGHCLFDQSGLDLCRSADVSSGEDWEQTPLGGPVSRLYTSADGSLFARTNAGLFRTLDHGSAWLPVGLPPNPGPVSVDPTNPAVIYAGTPTSLEKSTDGGGSWATVLPLGIDTVLGLAVSPADPQIVYVAAGQGSGSFRFLRSNDGGATWAALEGPLMGDLCVWTVLLLTAHPTDPARVFRTSGCLAGRNVPIGETLEHSLDQGATWSAIFHPLLYPSRLVGGGGANPERFYVGAHLAAEPAGGALFRSDDDGASWNPILTYTSGPSIMGLAYDPAAPDLVFAGLTTGIVRRSTDGGVTWEDVGQSGLGGITDIKLSLNGEYAFAATTTGVWRLPR
jgi:hypothetical protein